VISERGQALEQSRERQSAGDEEYRGVREYHGILRSIEIIQKEMETLLGSSQRADLASCILNAILAYRDAQFDADLARDLHEIAGPLAEVISKLEREQPDILVALGAPWDSTNCSPSALVRQIEGLRGGRISGSS
jgi:hypothetical protein